MCDVAAAGAVVSRVMSRVRVRATVGTGGTATLTVTVGAAEVTVGAAEVTVGAPSEPRK